MELSLHCPCVYPLIKQTQQGFRIANHLLLRDVPSSPFALQNPSFQKSLSRTVLNGDRRSLPQEKASSSSSSLMVKSKKSPDEQTSNQEEIIALFKRIKTSISKGKSQIDKEKSLARSSENEPMTKAILNVLEKSRKKPKGDTKNTPKRKVKLTQPTSSVSKRSPMPSASGSIVKNDKALEEMSEKEEEKASLMETMKLAELKEIAKNKGNKGYSKLKKSELLELLKSS